MAALLGLPAICGGADSLYELIQNKDYVAALKVVERDLATTPSDDFELRFTRAFLLAATGKNKEAENAYQELITRYPGRPEPYNNLATLYSSQGQLDQAQALLRAGLYTDPTYRILFDNLTQIYAEQAARSLRGALDPSDPAAGPKQPVNTLEEIPGLVSSED